jgi:hypothetical protein
VGWLFSIRWLWSMTMPVIALEFAAIVIAAVCLNLTAALCAQRLRARRESAADEARMTTATGMTFCGQPRLLAHSMTLSH